MGPSRRSGSSTSQIAAADDPEAEHDGSPTSTRPSTCRRPRRARGLHRRAGLAARHAPAAGELAGSAVGSRRLRRRREEHPPLMYVALGDSFTAASMRAAALAGRARAPARRRPRNLAEVGPPASTWSASSWSVPRALARCGDARLRRQRRAVQHAPRPGRLRRPPVAHVRAAGGGCRRLRSSPPPIRTSRASSPCARARARVWRRGWSASTPPCGRSRRRRRGADGELRPPGGQDPLDLRGRRVPPLGGGPPRSGPREFLRALRKRFRLSTA